MRSLRAANLRHRRHNLSRHTQAAAAVVPGDVDHHHAEEWASALGLQRVLGLGSYQTAWPWMHKLRRAMVRPARER